MTAPSYVIENRSEGGYFYTLLIEQGLGATGLFGDPVALDDYCVSVFSRSTGICVTVI